MYQDSVKPLSLSEVEETIHGYVYPTIKQVGEIIDTLYPIWSHFGNKESLIEHFGEYDNNGEKHADAIFNVIFRKPTDSNTKIKIVFWKKGIQIFERNNNHSKVISNTENFHLHNYLIANNLLGFKAHQELVKDKLFTMEDMQLLAAELIGKYKLGELKEVKDVQKIIDSRLPKTEWDITISEDGKIKLL